MRVPDRLLLFALLSLIAPLSLITARTPAHAAPGGGVFIYYSADAPVVDLGTSGCLSAFASDIGASAFLMLNASTSRVQESLVSIVLTVENTCTGQTEYPIVATATDPGGFQGSSNGAHVEGAIPYADTVIQVDVSWVCTSPMVTIEQAPGLHAVTCPALATGTIAFRGETFTFSSAGTLSRGSSSSRG
jgi:hypothetical protein